MTTPRKRIVTVRLTARDINDPAAILDAVREALRAQDMQLRVCSLHENPTQSTEPEKQIALEQLETAALRVAAQHLDDKARELEARGGQAGEESPSPEQIAKTRKKLIDWVKSTAKAGWRVTVVSALDWAKKQVGMGAGD
jgi:hypothetical protein